MVRQPTKYSCLPACLAFICDLNIQDYFDTVGHNCSSHPASDTSAIKWVESNGFKVTAYLAIDSYNQQAVEDALSALEMPAVLRVNKSTEYDHAVVVYPTPTGLKILDPSDAGIHYLFEYKYPISGLYLIAEEIDANVEADSEVHKELHRVCKI